SLKELLPFDRPRFPARVNCWFCGVKSSVPYSNRNSWDCSKCEQYNGFDKDGNYNKPILAQYDEKLNRPFKCKEAEFLGGHDLLCDRCSQNQLLKVKQLANFTPYDEKNFNAEVEAFSRHLEKVYRLCQQCEINVAQELETQDEAIAMRLSHLDDSQRNLIGLNSYREEQQTLLHSSYRDHSWNKSIVASVVDLTGKADWQKLLLPLHPYLLWLDLHTQTITAVGLTSCILAKLILGKYRLHIVDVLGCPFWLVLLLLETGYLRLTSDYLLYFLAGLVANVCVCIGSLVTNRRRRNQSDITLTRQQLDSSFSDTASSVSPLSSVSQFHSDVTDRSGQNERSRLECDDMSGSRSPDYPRSEVRNIQDNEVTTSRPQSKRQRVMKSNEPNENGLDPNIKVKTEPGLDESVHETTFELHACSLGEPGLIPRNNSGLFSTVTQSTTGSSSDQSTRGRGSPNLPSTYQPSLFFVNSPDFPTSFNLHGNNSLHSNHSSVSQSSAFTPMKTSSNHDLPHTPKRSSTPVSYTFGQSPFSRLPHRSDSFSQLSWASTPTQGNSHIRSRSSLSARRNNCMPKRYSPVVRRAEMSDHSDEELDNLTDFTSVTQRCRVHSTSGSMLQENSASVGWKSGLFGFVLGGSLVANIMLGLFSWQQTLDT
ncbi:TM201-like protein, partial [Mya arenaria]